MPKDVTPATDPHKAKRHKFYGSPEIVEAFDKLCAIERRSRSEIIVMLVKARLRQKARKMRKAGIKMPAEVLKK